MRGSQFRLASHESREYPLTDCHRERCPIISDRRRRMFGILVRDVILLGQADMFWAANSSRQTNLPPVHLFNIYLRGLAVDEVNTLVILGTLSGR